MRVLRFLSLSSLIGAAIAVQVCDISCESPGHRPNEPLFARVALNPDSSMMLRVAFIESQGPETGYDVVYATLESNGRAGPTQTFKAVSGTERPGFRCDFPAIRLTGRYTNPATRVTTSYPCEIVFAYDKYASARRGIPLTSTGSRIVSTGNSGSFSVSSTVSLRRGPDESRYTFRGTISPSRDLASAPTWEFLESPSITVTTRPDGRNPGNTGIGLSLAAGANQFECQKGGKPLTAHVEVKTADGTVLHRGIGTLDKFTFG